MTHKPTSILVNIRRLGKWYLATSEDLKGLRVAHPDLTTVIAEIPDVIKAIYKARYGAEMVVKDETPEDTKDLLPLRYSAVAA